MKTTLETQKILDSIAKKKGYEVYGTPFDNNYVNQTRKTITMQAWVTDDRNIKLTHELGHVYSFKIWKWFVVMNEILAWTIGYFICKRNNINTKNFWGIAKQCLKSYINS